MTVVGGIKSFTVDGIAYDVSEVGGLAVSEEKLESVPVLAGTPGSKVSQTIPYLEITISTRGVRVKDVVAQKNVTPQLNLANGKSYIWPDACEVGEGQVDPNDGKLPLKYESATAKEL